MAIDASELLARVGAIEIEALAALAVPIASTAVPRWLYQQESTPYWRNRIVSFRLDTASDDLGEEMEVWVYIVGAQLVMGHYTQGYNGEIDEAILTTIPQVCDYLDAREVLQSATYPTGMAFLRKAWTLGGSGYEILSQSPAGSPQVGPTFQFQCIFDKSLAQAYQ